MAQYHVYMHNVPKVSDDGKVVPIAPHRVEELADLDEARKTAAQHKDEFERVTLIETEDGKQRMVERYMDGEHIVPEPKEEPKAEEPKAKEPAADEKADD